MHTKTFASALGFAALLVGFGSAASAQFIRFPEPSTLLTAKDVATRLPALQMYSLADDADMKFQDKNGTLVLTLAPTFWANKKPSDQVLWSGKIDTAPRKFFLVTMLGEQDLKDDAGKILWSKKFEQPSLTLDLDQPGQARLFDSMGKELTGQITGVPSPLLTNDQANALFKARDFSSGYSRIGNVVIERDRQRRQTTIYSSKKLIWSGTAPPNNGVQFGRTLNSQIEGIPAPPYPIGQTTTFEVTKEAGNISIADKDHRFLETISSETLTLTASTSDVAFRKNPHNFFFFQPHVAVTQPAPVTGGSLYARYSTADGEWLADEKVDAVRTEKQISSLHETMTGMELHIQSFDQSGNPTSKTTIGYDTSS